MNPFYMFYTEQLDSILLIISYLTTLQTTSTTHFTKHILFLYIGWGKGGWAGLLLHSHSKLKTIEF